MTTQLHQDRPPSGPVVPIPVPVLIPKGFCAREASHAPLPWTPFTGSLLSMRGGAVRAMCTELGLLFETLDLRDIGGWEYIRIVPLGDRQPPTVPGWLVPLLVRVVPSLRRRIRLSVAAVRSDVPGGLVRRWGEQWQPTLAARTATLRDIELPALDDAELDRHLDAVLALARDGVDAHFRLHGAISMALGDLAFTCRDLLGWEQAQVAELLAGTSRMSTTPARALAGVTALARRRPALRRLIEGEAPVESVLVTDPDFAEAFGTYLREYGCRALRYELGEPCLDEQPELVLALVRGQLATGFDPDAAQAALDTRRAEVRREALRLLDGRGPSVRDRFERALERALLAYPVREDNEFYTISGPLALARRTALEFGRRLVAQGLLDSPDDAFLLEVDELRAALRGRHDHRDLARRRAGEREWVLAHPGPPSYGTPPGPPPPMSALPAEARLANEAFLWAIEQTMGPPSDPADHPGGAPEPAADQAAPAPRETGVTGVPVSPGSYTGPARVILGESEFDRLQPGDVLVCPATAPVWSVLFPSIGALVADFGGNLSHQAIIAREYGIPAVVGAGDATARLTDGQLVTVDGAAGTVRPAG